VARTPKTATHKNHPKNIVSEEKHAQGIVLAPPRGQQQSKNGAQDFKISRFHWDLRISMGFQDFTKIQDFTKSSKSHLDFMDFTKISWDFIKVYWILLKFYEVIKFHGISMRFHRISEIIEKYNVYSWLAISCSFMHR